MLADLYSDCIRRAVGKDLSAVELLGAAEALGAGGEPGLQRSLYQVWLEHNVGDPLAYAIHFNYGVVLTNANDLPEAMAALEAAIALSPDFLPPYINLGMVKERLGGLAGGVESWQTVANKLALISSENIGHKLSALKQLARVYEAANFDAHGEDVLRRSLDIDPHQRDILQHYLKLRQQQCRWPVADAIGSLDKKQVIKGFSPLSLAVQTDDPLFQLANAWAIAKFDIAKPARTFMDSHPALLLDRPTGRRLRIGYLSSDLRGHAVGFLTTEIFELHDRNTVEVFVYYCGVPSDDLTHRRIKAGADQWLSVTDMPDEALANRIVGDRIDILVDLNGHTRDARTSMLAMRPAPIIVNWLGFPGSMGTDYHNYIIADPVIIPEDHEIFYSETVKRLPCYQPNDRGRVVSEVHMTRASLGLPTGGVVFCGFNSAYKITPFTWKRWMAILAKVPNSVLWLLTGSEEAKKRLYAFAADDGIGAERIIFAPPLINAEHLVRYRHADLFLDTAPYGGHTTASDALYMGLPVLTLSGRSFASRVCGSLNTSAGLEDLVCTSSEDYVAKAVALANNPARLAEYRRRLLAARDSCLLFDTPLLVSKLEELYGEMWEDFRQGRVPRPDLSNLDIYLDIGAELGTTEQDEMLGRRDYLDLYREKLKEMGQLAYIRADARLWPGN